MTHFISVNGYFVHYMRERDRERKKAFCTFPPQVVQLNYHLLTKLNRMYYNSNVKRNSYFKNIIRERNIVILTTALFLCDSANLSRFGSKIFSRAY